MQDSNISNALAMEITAVFHSATKLTSNLAIQCILWPGLTPCGLDHILNILEKICYKIAFITSRPRQNWRHFADNIFKYIFLNESVWIAIKISLKFVPKGPINNNPALFR